MFDWRDMYGARFDGVEALAFAFTFIAGMLVGHALGLALDLAGASALGVGFGATALLRRLRPSRVTNSEGQSRIGTPRTFASLLLLGVGWFVIAIALFAAVVVAAFTADRGVDVLVLVAPAAPLLVGSALVYAGLRVG
jgi:hypothetical protein